MNEKILEQNLSEAFIRDWEIIPTGSGFLVVSDWLWPNHERIEIHARTVGEREDLFVVADGGELGRTALRSTFVADKLCRTPLVLREKVSSMP